VKTPFTTERYSPNPHLKRFSHPLGQRRDVGTAGEFLCRDASSRQRPVIGAEPIYPIALFEIAQEDESHILPLFKPPAGIQKFHAVSRLRNLSVIEQRSFNNSRSGLFLDGKRLTFFHFSDVKDETSVLNPVIR
jgi:hypothetical protein